MRPSLLLTVFSLMPGVGHGAAGTPYGSRRLKDFFVRHLLGVEPRWGEAPAPAGFGTRRPVQGRLARSESPLPGGVPPRQRVLPAFWWPATLQQCN